MNFYFYDPETAKQITAEGKEVLEEMIKIVDKAK